MAVFLSPVGGVAAQFFTNNGVILSGGKLYAYAAGTTTPQATFTSSSGNTNHANPIILDSAGRVPGGEIWLSTSPYKFVLKDSSDVLIGTYDNVYGLSNVVLSIDASTVTYTPAGTNAVQTTVQAKLRQYVSVFDFMTSAQIADVQANTALIDVTAAIKAAIGTGNVSLYFPPGTYLVTTLYISTLSSIEFVGVPGASIIKKKAGTYGVNVDGAISGIFDFVNCNNITLTGITFNGNKANATPSVGTQLNGVNFYISTKIKTTYCQFININFVGLNHQCCYNAVTTDSYFKDIGQIGLNMSGGYFDTFGAAEAQFLNNTFVNIYAGVQAQIATTYVNVVSNTFIKSSILFSQDLSKSLISNNTIDGIAPAGIESGPIPDGIMVEAASSITIIANVINAVGRNGIYVLGNYILNGPNEGVLASNNVSVIGNTVLNCTSGAGIVVAPGSPYTYVNHVPIPATEANYTYAKWLSVTDNVVIGCSFGLTLGIAENSVIANNLIDRSIADGLTISSVKYSVIKNNTITNSSTAGAGVYDAISFSLTSTILSNISIIGNQLFDSQGSPTQRYGIFANNVNITNLKIKDNPTYSYGSSVFSVVNSNPTTLIAPTLLNSATNLGGFAPATYFKDGDSVVHLRGTVVLGASGAGASIFVLPSGYLPSADEKFSVIQNGAIGLCTVKTDGTVEATTGTNSQYFNLSGISFYGIN